MIHSGVSIINPEHASYLVPLFKINFKQSASWVGYRSSQQAVFLKTYVLKQSLGDILVERNFKSVAPLLKSHITMDVLL